MKYQTTLSKIEKNLVVKRVSTDGERKREHMDDDWDAPVGRRSQVRGVDHSKVLG